MIHQVGAGSGAVCGLHLIAFLALIAHIALPTALQIAGPATQGLFETVICAGGENKTVYMDAEGNPVEPAPAGTSHDCNSCLHHCGAMLASTVALATPGWSLPALAAPVLRIFAERRRDERPAPRAARRLTSRRSSPDFRLHAPALARQGASVQAGLMSSLSAFVRGAAALAFLFAVSPSLADGF